jgi:hypothetical protein
MFIYCSPLVSEMGPLHGTVRVEINFIAIVIYLRVNVENLVVNPLPGHAEPISERLNLNVRLLLASRNYVRQTSGLSRVRRICPFVSFLVLVYCHLVFTLVPFPDSVPLGSKSHRCLFSYRRPPRPPRCRCDLSPMAVFIVSALLP